jgi:hypothetical protein
MLPDKQLCVGVGTLEKAPAQRHDPPLHIQSTEELERVVEYRLRSSIEIWWIGPFGTRLLDWAHCLK